MMKLTTCYGYCRKLRNEIRAGCQQQCGSVGEWLGSQNCDQQVEGSTPGISAATLGKLFTYIVPLSPSSTAGMAESIGSLPPGVGHLQADNPEPGPAPEPYTLVSNTGLSSPYISSSNMVITL